MKRKLLILRWTEGDRSLEQTAPFFIEVDNDINAAWLSDEQLKGLIRTLNDKEPRKIIGIYSFDLSQLPVHRFIKVPSWVKV